MGVGALHKHRGNGPSTTGRKVQDHPQTLDNNFCFLPASAKNFEGVKDEKVFFVRAKINPYDIQTSVSHPAAVVEG